MSNPLAKYSLQQKDVKQSVSKPSPVLPKGMPGAAPAQLSRQSVSTNMVDDKEDVSGGSSPPSPSAPSSTSLQLSTDVQKSDVKAILKGCRLDISKLDPSDPKNKEVIEAVRSYVGFALGGWRHGIRPAKKCLISGITGATCILQPTGSDFADDFTTYSNSANAGWSAIGFVWNGDNINNRLGRTIVVTSLHWRISVTWTILFGTYANGAGAGQMAAYGQGLSPVRMVVFEDRMPLAPLPTNFPSGTTPTYNDQQALFYNQTGTDPMPIETLAQFNPTTHGFRYRILYDKLIHPSQTAGLTQVVGGTAYWSQSSRTNHEHEITMNHRVDYADDNTSSSTTVIRGQIYVGFFQDRLSKTAYVETIPATIDYSARMSFIDS